MQFDGVHAIQPGQQYKLTSAVDMQALLAMYQRETFIQGLLGGQPPEMSEDAPKVWWRRCNNVTAVGAAWTWQKGTPCIRSRRDSTASPDKVLELGTHQVKGLHMS